MNKRIDYVKLSYHANNADSALDDKERLSGMWASYQASTVFPGGKLDWNNVYDGRGNWLLTADVSGPASQDFLLYYCNTLIDFPHVTRLDYRFELDVSLPDKAHDAVYYDIRALNTRNRNVNRGHARPRDKGQKRDGGGNRVSVGSLQSDKYLAVYTKPGEKTAVEVKISGAVCNKLMQEVELRARAVDGSARTRVDNVLMLLEEKARQHIMDVTGLDVEGIAAYANDEETDLKELMEFASGHQIVSSFSRMPRAEQLSLLNELVDECWPKSK